MEKLSNSVEESLSREFIKANRLTPSDQLLITGLRQEYLAWETDSQDEARTQLELAKHNFEKVLEDGKRYRYLSGSDVEAACHLNFLPIVEPLVMDGKMPDLEEVNNSRFRLARFLNKSLEKQNPKNPVVKSYNICAVVCLLQYWQTNIYKDSDWLALPAFLDQPLDKLDVNGNIPAAHGTVNVYVQEEQKPEIKYRIFVGSDASSMVDSIPDDISVVWISDLRLPGEESISSHRIISEMYRKEDNKINERIDILLDVIDHQTAGSIRSK